MVNILPITMLSVDPTAIACTFSGIIVLCNARVIIVVASILIIRIMLCRIPVEFDKLFAGFCQTKAEHLIVEIDLHVLMSFLEFANGDLLPLI